VRTLSTPEWLLLIALLLGAAVVSTAPINEKDVFWHVASGRYILEHRRLPEPDPFTFTAGDRKDVHHEWLSQVLLAEVDRVSGLRGLRILRGILLATTLALGFAAFRRRTRHYALAFVALLLWWIVTQPNVTMRPHLFGWLLAVLVLGLLLTRPGVWSARRHVALFALYVLWANLHSSVLIVPLCLALSLASALLERMAFKDGGSGSAPLRPYALQLALSALACCLQPAGPRLVPYVLRTPAVNEGLSVEWLPLLAPDVWKHHAVLLAVFGLIAAGAVVAVILAWRRKGSEWPGLLVTVALLALALHTRRMTFFLFLPLMAAAGELSRWIETRGRARTSPAGASRPRAAVASLVACALLAAAALAINRRPDTPLFTRKDLASKRFPELAAMFLAEAQLQGRMFNPVDWGGYLSYTLYPEYRTLGDGRWILFGRNVVLDVQRVLNREGDLEPIFDRYAIDYLLQPVSSYLATPPLDPARWVLAYYDDATVILLRRSGRFEENVSRVCEFYRRYPQSVRHARWQFELHGAPGGPTPTSLPSVLDLCGADESSETRSHAAPDSVIR
jgi:hypothetical protein